MGPGRPWLWGCDGAFIGSALVDSTLAGLALAGLAFIGAPTAAHECSSDIGLEFL